MVKEREFFEAARNGNIAVVEKALSQKHKRAGPLVSLRRGPGVNLQDNCGYSALHHACINGHNDIVRLLLAHGASPNLPDIRGSFPLHLAAWAGHEGILQLLLTYPNITVDPNCQTFENETPLHFSAQHGHTDSLAILLAHGADPNKASNRGETPLDLAAQYGRLQSVQILVREHPELIAAYKNIPTGSFSTSPPLHLSFNAKLESPKCSIFPQTCLHLASRNGHNDTVQFLLSSEVSVNLLTPSGTALHEAALCGKESVVRTLLGASIDLHATDAEGRTALDILNEFPPNVTKNIIDIIKNFPNEMDADNNESVRNWKKNSKDFLTLPKDLDVNNGMSYCQTHATFSSLAQTTYLKSDVQSNQSSDFLQPNNHMTNYNHSIHKSTEHNHKNTIARKDYKLIGQSSENVCETDDLKHFGISPTSSTCVFEPTSVPSRLRSINDIAVLGSAANEYPGIFAPAVPPKKPPRRNISFSPTRSENLFRSSSPGPSKNSTNHHWLERNSRNANISLLSDTINNQISINDWEKKRDALGSTNSKNGIADKRPNLKIDNTVSLFQNTMSLDILPLAKRHLPEKCGNATIAKDIVDCENPNFKSYNPNRKLRRIRNSYSLSISDKENFSGLGHSVNGQTSLSPTNFQQLLTPKHSPPSPRKAEQAIYEHIVPLSKEYKRRSIGCEKKSFSKRDSSTSPTKNLDVQNTTLTATSEIDHILSEKNQIVANILDSSDTIITEDCEDKGSVLLLNLSSSNLNDFDEVYIDNDSLTRLYKGSERKTGCESSGTELSIIAQIYTEREPKKPFLTNDFDFGNNVSQSGMDELILIEPYPETVGNNDHESLDCLNYIIDHIENDDDKQEKDLLNNKNQLLSSFNTEKARKEISEIIESFGCDILNTKTLSQLDINLDLDNPDFPTERHDIARRLQSFGLLHLEKTLIENGLDNIKFLNGVIEEDDLKVLHIPETDVNKLMAFILTLPKAEFEQQIMFQVEQTNESNKTGKDNIEGVSTLREWLKSIALTQYIETFNKHLYNTIDSVCEVWDVELQTVLEINKVGHRRRILKSLIYIRKMRGEISAAQLPSVPYTVKAHSATDTKHLNESSFKKHQDQQLRSSKTGYRKSR